MGAWADECVDMIVFLTRRSAQAVVFCLRSGGTRAGLSLWCTGHRRIRRQDFEEVLYCVGLQLSVVFRFLLRSAVLMHCHPKSCLLRGFGAADVGTLPDAAHSRKGNRWHWRWRTQVWPSRFQNIQWSL